MLIVRDSFISMNIAIFTIEMLEYGNERIPTFGIIKFIILFWR